MCLSPARAYAGATCSRRRSDPDTVFRLRRAPPRRRHLLRRIRCYRSRSRLREPARKRAAVLSAAIA